MAKAFDLACWLFDETAKFVGAHTYATVWVMLVMLGLLALSRCS